MSEDVRANARGLFVLRLSIGLLQGVALYGLERARRELDPVAFEALWLATCFAPIAALGAVGTLRRVALSAWLPITALVAAGLGAYEGYAQPEAEPWVSPQLFLTSAAALFILHHLITPADAEGRWRAGYDRYFDDGWKDAVRLALAAAFVGALWALLLLGAELFHLIGLDFLRELTRKPWFGIPITTSFFAIAIHLTDVRVNLVRGARTLALTLLSWLLPVFVVLTVGFLAALPFTGLAPLWATRSATGSMLAACAALIILINATYQEGERPGFPPSLLKWSARLGAAALAPLVGLAAYGLALRVGQHGWSPSRVYAAACLLVGACYAVGYLFAALARDAWMRPLEATNWITAQVAVGVLLLIFSPVVDPARISVQNQMRRLTTGRVEPRAFDYGFLHFRSGRWGQAALNQLVTASTDERGRLIAQLARAELNRRQPWEPRISTQADRTNLVRVIGGSLPQDFLSQSWNGDEDPARGCETAPGCVAIVGELDGSPDPEVVVFGLNTRRVYSRKNGRWRGVGMLVGEICQSDLESLRGGRFQFSPHATHADLDLDGRRLIFVDNAGCKAASAPKSPSGQASASSSR